MFIYHCYYFISLMLRILNCFQLSQTSFLIMEIKQDKPIQNFNVKREKKSKNRKFRLQEHETFERHNPTARLYGYRHYVPPSTLKRNPEGIRNQYNRNNM